MEHFPDTAGDEHVVETAIDHMVLLRSEQPEGTTPDAHFRRQDAVLELRTAAATTRRSLPAGRTVGTETDPPTRTLVH